VLFGQAAEPLQDLPAVLSRLGEIGVEGINDEQSSLGLTESSIEESFIKRPRSRGIILPAGGGRGQQEMEAAGVAAEGVETGAENVFGAIVGAKVENSRCRPFFVSRFTFDIV
jgi:hypothetical protein